MINTIILLFFCFNTILSIMRVCVRVRSIIVINKMRSVNCFVLLQKSADGRLRDVSTIDNCAYDRLSILNITAGMINIFTYLYIFQFVFIISATGIMKCVKYRKFMPSIELLSRPTNA